MAAILIMSATLLLLGRGFSGNGATLWTTQEVLRSHLALGSR